MTCFNCRKASLESRTADVPAEIKKEKLVVRMEALICPNCGYTTVTGHNMPEYMRLAADAYRKKNDLLTSAEIAYRRNRLRMTQEMFAEYLGVGVASVKRWELGKIQDRAMDNLMRLKTSTEEAAMNLEQVKSLIAEVQTHSLWSAVDGACILAGK